MLMVGATCPLTGGLAHYEFGVDLDGVRKFFIGQFLQQRARRQSAHLLQRLPDSCQAGNNVRSGLNIVKAEHGDVRRHLQSRIMKRSYAADVRDGVETETCRKISAPQQELMYSRIPKLRCVQVLIQLNGQILGHLERKRACYLDDGLPSGLRVRAERL